MVYDCFLFFNELELLELRLATLSEVVDRFVLVESDCTFQGQQKEMTFMANRERFQPYLNRIEHVVVQGLPKHENAWEIRRDQCNSLLRGLTNCVPGDLVFLSDLDEIPNPLAVLSLQRDERCLKILKKDPIVMAQQMYYYYANCLDSEVWYGSIAIRWENFTMTPEELRTLRFRLPRMRDGGWHFTYMGGPERIKTKLASLAGAAESRLASEIDVDTIENRMKNAENILVTRGDRKFTRIEIDTEYPVSFQEWLADHPDWISGSPEELQRRPAPKPTEFISNIRSWNWFKLRQRINHWFHWD